MGKTGTAQYALFDGHFQEPATRPFHALLMCTAAGCLWRRDARPQSHRAIVSAGRIGNVPT
ncbi:hypothetical protein SBA4_60002 [Candidatus Sulfopaludibacter sp. SbA4]|nr:hypothetical protein SBA4_60002 [Candidatus Sulfopaludibacter sp. SbA4]